MPNSVTSFYQTVVAGVQDACRLLVPAWGMMQSIFYDFRPEEAALGQTLNIAIPNDPTANVADMGAGDMVLQDIGFSTVPIVFNEHPVFAYVVRDFEQFNSPAEIRRVFADAAIKGLHNFINTQIVGLINTTNFTTNQTSGGTLPFVASGGTFYACTGGSTSGHCMSMTELTTVLQKQLALKNVPVLDPDNMSVVLHPDAYFKMMDATPTLGTTAPKYDPSFTQALIAGERIAEQTRREGYTTPLSGTSPRLDQQMPTTSTTNTGILMHRWAIAMAARPLPKPDAKVVDFQYLNASMSYSNYPKMGPTPITLPIRLMMSYNQYPKQGYIVSVDAGFGLKVVRESMAIPFTVVSA